MRSGRLARGMVLFALVLAIGLAAAEFGLRVARPRPPPSPQEELAQWDGWRGLTHRRSCVPGLAFELVPDLERTVYGWKVSTNSLGMRDDEPLEVPGSLRIAAIGDSYTFGWGVDQAQTWPQVLEHSLDGAAAVGGRRVDVLNLGVSGYSTRDEVLVLETRGLALEPRLLILQYCVNDPETRPVQPLHRYFAGQTWWRRSALLTSVVERLQQRAYGRRGSYFHWLHVPESAAWVSVVAGFGRMRALCDARGIPVLLVLFPILGPRPWDQYRYRDLHVQVAAEGDRQGFAVLDLLAVFERVPPAELLLDPTDSHPNLRGHALAAEAIEGFLASSGALARALESR